MECNLQKCDTDYTFEDKETALQCLMSLSSSVSSIRDMFSSVLKQGGNGVTDPTLVEELTVLLNGFFEANKIRCSEYWKYTPRISPRDLQEYIDEKKTGDAEFLSGLLQQIGSFHDTLASLKLHVTGT